jgi:hypothetical protein
MPLPRGLEIISALAKPSKEMYLLLYLTVAALLGAVYFSFFLSYSGYF